MLCVIGLCISWNGDLAHAVTGSFRTIQGVAVPSDFPAVTTHINDSPDPGFIYLSTLGSVPYVLMLDNAGTPLFYKKLNQLKSVEQEPFDFKAQPNGFWTYYDRGYPAHIVMDSTYTVVDTIRAGNGYWPNAHELRLLANGHALIIGSRHMAVDMSRIVDGGNPKAIVRTDVVQELDRERNVIFEWRAWDHFEITDAVHENLRASFIDYCHMNSIDVDTDGHLLISSRHLSEITKIHRRSGRIIWRFGGVNNQFRLVNDDRGISYQHSIHGLGDGRYLLFDNGNHHSPPYSRAVEYHLDEATRRATLVWEYDGGGEYLSRSLANVQRLPSGNTLINWAYPHIPKLTEVRPDCTLVYELDFDDYAFTYRTFRFPQQGQAEVPYLIAEPHADHVLLVFNQFGEAPVARYNIYGGTSPHPQARIASTEDNAIELSELQNLRKYYFRTTAVDDQGRESGYSNEVAVFVHFMDPSSDRVLNGDFSQGDNFWQLKTSDQAVASRRISDSGVYHLGIENGGSAQGSVQLIQEPIELIEGVSYVLELEAYAATSRPFSAKVRRISGHSPDYLRLGSKPLSSTPTKHSFPFLMEKQSDHEARLVLEFGSLDVDVFLQNVSLKISNPSAAAEGVVGALDVDDSGTGRLQFTSSQGPVELLQPVEFVDADGNAVDPNTIEEGTGLSMGIRRRSTGEVQAYEVVVGGALGGGESFNMHFGGFGTTAGGGVTILPQVDEYEMKPETLVKPFGSLETVSFSAVSAEDVLGYSVELWYTTDESGVRVVTEVHVCGLPEDPEPDQYSNRRLSAYAVDPETGVIRRQIMSILHEFAVWQDTQGNTVDPQTVVEGTRLVNYGRVVRVKAEGDFVEARERGFIRFEDGILYTYPLFSEQMRVASDVVLVDESTGEDVTANGLSQVDGLVRIQTLLPGRFPNDLIVRIALNPQDGKKVGEVAALELNEDDVLILRFKSDPVPLTSAVEFVDVSGNVVDPSTIASGANLALEVSETGAGEVEAAKVIVGLSGEASPSLVRILFGGFETLSDGREAIVPQRRPFEVDPAASISLPWSRPDLVPVSSILCPDDDIVGRDVTVDLAANESNEPVGQSIVVHGSAETGLAQGLVNAMVLDEAGGGTLRLAPVRPVAVSEITEYVNAEGNTVEPGSIGIGTQVTARVWWTTGGEPQAYMVRVGGEPATGVSSLSFKFGGFEMLEDGREVIVPQAADDFVVAPDQLVWMGNGDGSVPFSSLSAEDVLGFPVNVNWSEGPCGTNVVADLTVHEAVEIPPEFQDRFVSVSVVDEARRLIVLNPTLKVDESTEWVDIDPSLLQPDSELVIETAFIEDSAIQFVVDESSDWSGIDPSSLQPDTELVIQAVAIPNAEGRLLEHARRVEVTDEDVDYSPPYGDGLRVLFGGYVSFDGVQLVVDAESPRSVQQASRVWLKEEGADYSHLTDWIFAGFLSFDGEALVTYDLNAVTIATGSPVLALDARLTDDRTGADVTAGGLPAEFSQKSRLRMISLPPAENRPALLVAEIGLNVPGNNAETAAALDLDPEPGPQGVVRQRTTAGESIQLSVYLSGLAEVTGITVDVVYDPAQVLLEGASPGEGGLEENVLGSGAVFTSEGDEEGVVRYTGTLPSFFGGGVAARQGLFVVLEFHTLPGFTRADFTLGRVALNSSSGSNILKPSLVAQLIGDTGADFNFDGFVGWADLFLFADAWLIDDFDPIYDLNWDGELDELDLSMFHQQWGQVVGGDPAKLLARREPPAKAGVMQLQTGRDDEEEVELLLRVDEASVLAYGASLIYNRSAWRLKSIADVREGSTPARRQTHVSGERPDEILLVGGTVDGAEVEGVLARLVFERLAPDAVGSFQIAEAALRLTDGTVVQPRRNIHAEIGRIPKGFALDHNYPNPFNQSTKIPYRLAASSTVQLEVFDVAGRKVRTILTERQEAGFREARWDGRDEDGVGVASGVYFYRLTASPSMEDGASSAQREFVEVRKLMLLQ